MLFTAVQRVLVFSYHRRWHTQLLACLYVQKRTVFYGGFLFLRTPLEASRTKSFDLCV